MSKQPGRNLLLKLKSKKEQLKQLQYEAEIKAQDAIAAKKAADDLAKELRTKLQREDDLEESIECELQNENKYHPLLFPDFDISYNLTIPEFCRHRMTVPQLWWSDIDCSGLVKVYFSVPNQKPKQLGIGFSEAAIFQDSHLTTEQTIKWLSDHIARQMWDEFMYKNGRENYRMSTRDNPYTKYYEPYYKRKQKRVA